MKFVSSKREAIKKKKKVGRFRVAIYDPPYLKWKEFYIVVRINFFICINIFRVVLNKV